MNACWHATVDCTGLARRQSRQSRECAVPERAQHAPSVRPPPDQPRCWPRLPPLLQDAKLVDSACLALPVSSESNHRPALSAASLPALPRRRTPSWWTLPAWR